MRIECVWEHNGDDTILYAGNFAGAFTRGATREAALEKMRREVQSYLRWKGANVPDPVTVDIVQEKESDLEIRDADSDVIFETEKGPLTQEEYAQLKALVLKSAADFHALYMQIPDKDKSVLPIRKTFYGNAPRTASEMYTHTKGVNEYYFWEIGVDVDNEGTILQCRERGFAELEKQPGFLDNPVIEGSYGEMWSLRKVLRRFLWHDRIHAKAMYRMAVKTFGEGTVQNVFQFDL